MVSIGGILYPEEDMKDPEKRRKLELLADKIERMKEVDQLPRDYSEMPTDKLLKMALSVGGGNTWNAALRELSQRPKETRNAIDDLLDITEPYPGASLYFYRLPHLAKIFGPEYQVELTKKILEHPLTKLHNDMLLISPYVTGDKSVIEYLALSEFDETGVLDRLISESRLESGSKIEISMRKLLSEGKRTRSKQTDRDQKQININPSPSSNKKFSFENTPIIISLIAASVFLIVSGYLVWRRLRSTS
jgi:hypothetical protein